MTGTLKYTLHHRDIIKKEKHYGKNYFFQKFRARRSYESH